jgi:hypothetical protein
MPNNVVEAVSYSTELIPDKVSILLSDVTYKAKILAIVNDQITTPSAAFPLRKGFAQRSQLNKAAIALCESLFVSLH